MSDLIDLIAAQLRHLTHEQIVALVCDFLADLDEKQQARFLNLVVQGPRPPATEAMDLGDVEDLLDEIEALCEAIANDEYVQYGVGYDPDYGTHRGYGDDSWIDEMDGLFASATSFFRAGQFEAAVDAYIALFEVFLLSEDGFHFTRPEPAKALHTDMDAIKENLFVAIARSDPDPARQAIEVSGDLWTYGENRYALLDAWEGGEERCPELAEGWMAALEIALIARARRPAVQEVRLLSHPAELLREFYRRYRALSDYESLCREVGPQQGWPYEDLVSRCREQENWDQVLAWAEDGLRKLPAESCYRPLLREAQGEALLRLERPADAFDVLLALFGEQRWAAPVYLKLRQAARATGRWEALYPQLAAEMKAHVLATDWAGGYPVVILTEACLLGCAYLVEGEWEKAIAWALHPDVPAGWRDDDRVRTVATGLLRMGLAARGEAGDETLAEALCDAPGLVREHGELLELTARDLPADPLLDGAVRLYERLVERAIGGRNRTDYAQAGALCQVIRAGRRATCPPLRCWTAPCACTSGSSNGPSVGGTARITRRPVRSARSSAPDGARRAARPISSAITRACLPPIAAFARSRMSCGKPSKDRETLPLGRDELSVQAKWKGGTMDTAVEWTQWIPAYDPRRVDSTTVFEDEHGRLIEMADCGQRCPGCGICCAGQRDVVAADYAGVEEFEGNLRFGRGGLVRLDGDQWYRVSSCGERCPGYGRCCPPFELRQRPQTVTDARRILLESETAQRWEMLESLLILAHDGSAGAVEVLEAYFPRAHTRLEGFAECALDEGRYFASVPRNAEEEMAMLKREVLQAWEDRAIDAQGQIEEGTDELERTRYELEIVQRLLSRAQDEAARETWQVQVDVLQMMVVQAEDRLTEQQEELALCEAMIAEMEADLAADRSE
jgi:hypothetical protein